VIGDRSLIADFAVQAHEHLDAVEPLLLEIEKSGRVGGATANEIFREIHSIKGAADFLGLHAIAQLTHALEDVLVGLRDGQLAWSAPLADPLLRSVDHLRQLLGGLPEDGGQLDCGLLARVEALAASDAGGNWLQAACAAQLRRGHTLSVVALPESGRERAEFLSRLVRFAQIVREDFPSSERALVGSALESDLLALALGLAPTAVVAWRGEDDVDSGPESSPSVSRVPDSVRVQVALLDRLMDLSGQLGAVRDRLLRSAEGPVGELARELDRIASALRHDVALSRLQPVRMLFERMPRLVRDVAQRLGKQVELELCGSDLEVDRSLLEALADPLTHLVRNALDHGLETPQAREAASKPLVGRLVLRAEALRGRLRLELEDDGAGIDRARVCAAAVRRGVIGVAEAAALDSREVLELIFAAGISTAPAVSDLSGRGVGLDVVRTNLERLGGRIEVHSEPGRGTRFRIDIPLTRAFAPSLAVTVGSDTWVIQQFHVARVARWSESPSECGDELERVAGREYFRVAGRCLPFVRLDQVLGVGGGASSGAGAGRVLLVRCGSGGFALGVDELADAGPVVVEPLPERLSECIGYSGCALLSDGRPALVLDPVGIAHAAGLRLDELPEIPAPQTRLTGPDPPVALDRAGPTRPRLPRAVADGALPEAEPAARGYCTFRLAGESFALELGSLCEVRSGLDITPVRGAPPAVIGLVNLRGRIATAIDPHAALGLEDERGSEYARLLVVGRDRELLALRVDEVGFPVDLGPAEIEALPGAPDWLAGIASSGLRVLDAGRVLGGSLG